jgi:hypothetical protein
MFGICKQQNCVVAKVIDEDEINLTFRNFNTPERLEWEEMEKNARKCLGQQ